MTKLDIHMSIGLVPTGVPGVGFKHAKPISAVLSESRVANLNEFTIDVTSA